MALSRPPDRRGTVLVVDDTHANRELLSQDLEDEGFEVILASSGEECLLTAERDLPQVVLMDIKMPGMDGIEACRRLKANPATAHIPVLFVTANRADEASAVEALAAGGNDFLSKPYSPPILIARVMCQVTIARAHARLRKMAMTDELTGVFSRRFLFDSLRRTLKAATRDGPNCVGCLIADVDHFKAINDRHGHLEGDTVLRRIAQTIDRATRETDIVARYGGEEFAVILPSTDLDGAVLIAEKIRSSVEERCGPVTISIGATALCDDAISAVGRALEIDKVVNELLRLADLALYAAKAAGRNCVVAEARA